MDQFYVYILASKKRGTLYIGFTNDIERRILEHKNNNSQGFTSKYNVHTLVYYETHKTSFEAFTRERQLKKWKREWKIKLIEKENPSWDDLAKEWV
ncbi:MAG: GIY-YIG nuclease family protein [Bacteroidales bacterium]|nr:MAG: GIY-YIG nuclease family protein [Bacteroidales bacterium]